MDKVVAAVSHEAYIIIITERGVIYRLYNVGYDHDLKVQKLMELPLK